jgi:Ca2+-binding RTX toxin-like protein
MLLAALCGAAMLALAGAAQADTTQPLWKCRASAGYTSLNGGARTETIVANGKVGSAAGEDPDQAVCASAEVGGGNLPTPLGIPAGLLSSPTASAVTSIDPPVGASYDQHVSASARVGSLTLRLPDGGEVTIGATEAQSSASGGCDGATPRLSGSSRVTGLTLGGVVIDADALGPALADALSSLAPTVTSTANEMIRTADSLSVRALHIVVRRGAATVLDAVLAESKVGFAGTVCSDLVLLPGICPDGTLYSKRRGICVIPADQNDNEIAYGPPFSGPRGGRVMSLNDARKKAGNVDCLYGSGPKFAMVDTKNHNAMTGGPGPDRMLGLKGNDRIDGTRGNDCIDGGPGSDDLVGAKGNDRLFGRSGNDHLNGVGGNDTLDGGSGNDTINAGFGRDRASGGPGRDYINIAAAGDAATANCGSGADKVRFNNNERKKINRNCETKYRLRDR